ncbi:Facilitated trehalose transporter Tret1 [Eumeta japonica]|uniref:Facilitated trehalose transporter Tret1 n=1 Tax=Eumeta variegata TaxID=151549 RepID=A0A4C1Z295_EUMVA|nr:Facilitated trehalose transporter Tret1 [Eumeta japonica]
MWRARLPRRIVIKNTMKVGIDSGIINFPLLIYGSSVGWMSPMTLILQSDKSPRGTPFTDDEISWMASAPFITSIPAVVAFGFVVDKFGRKLALLLCTAQFLGCWVIKLSSHEFGAFVAARSLVGVGMAGCYVVTPLYTNEISDSTIRGALGTLTILSQTVGNLLLYIVGGMLSYRSTLWFSLSLPIAHILLAVTIPESPAYLIRKGKKEKANRVVAWLRCRRENDPLVQREMDNLNKEQAQESNKFALKEILTDTILFRAFRMTLALALAREVCGTLPVLHFASDIFKQATEGGVTLRLSPNEQAMMLGGVQPLLFATSLISGLGMCLLAVWFLLRSMDVALPGWIPIAALCLCIFCDASGLQPISVVVLGEMFSFKEEQSREQALKKSWREKKQDNRFEDWVQGQTRRHDEQYRSTVNAITEGLACAIDFLQLRFFKPISSSVGVHVTFFFFSAVCLINAVYVIIVVPETRARSVDEIYEDITTERERAEHRSKGNDNFVSRL